MTYLLLRCYAEPRRIFGYLALTIGGTLLVLLATQLLMPAVSLMAPAAQPHLLTDPADYLTVVDTPAPLPGR